MLDPRGQLPRAAVAFATLAALPVHRGPHMQQAAAWLLVIAGFVSAVVAFFLDAERPATNPWLLFVAGVGLAVVGIILIAFDRGAR